jgi:ribosomal protein L37E
MPRMADPKAVPPSPPPSAAPSATVPSGGAACRDDAMVCERCGQAEMYRMHAVWRCPACGFKTDCCGW